MERRFAHHGLDERARFVPAIAISTPRDSSQEWKAEAGRHAAASHLDCMRRMLDEVPEEEGGAIICEDDVLIHDEFRERLPWLLANLPEDAGACLLGFLANGGFSFPWSGIEAQRENLVPVVPGETWGAHGYWVTHAFARRQVDSFGHLAIADLSNEVESLVTFPSSGHCAYPPLMLQESVDSVVRPEDEVTSQAQMQAAWPYRFYAAAEAMPPISPLAWFPDRGRRLSHLLASAEVGEVKAAVPDGCFVDRVDVRIDGSGRVELAIEVVEPRKREERHRGVVALDLGELSAPVDCFGISTTSEEGHRIELRGSGISPGFAFTDLPGETCTGLIATPEVLVIGFVIGGSHAMVAVCDAAEARELCVSPAARLRSRQAP